MILDVEAVRSFLVEQNNAGDLNLELLCVVGFEMGSVVALNWIYYDWSVPSWPTFKQGQDVKAFVLVSPEQTFKGASTRRALANPIVRGELSAMLIYGKDDPASSTGERLYTSLKRSHRPVPTDPERGTEAAGPVLGGIRDQSSWNQAADEPNTRSHRQHSAVHRTATWSTAKSPFLGEIGRDRECREHGEPDSQADHREVKETECGCSHQAAADPVAGGYHD